MKRALLGILAFVLSSCVYHGHAGYGAPMKLHPHGMPPGQAKKLAHVHAHGCGHVMVDGVWVVVRG
jgi:hypothetical protein